MAHDSKLISGSLDKPAEHPAKAIMAKRWEERRAEARARRVAELRLGDSGIITLKGLVEPAAISSTPAAALPLPAPATDADDSAPASAVTAAAPTPDADSSHSGLAALSAVLPPAADSGMATAATAAALPATTPRSSSWLRDSRKAMLIVALVSHSLLLALLYFGGFLG